MKSRSRHQRHVPAYKNPARFRLDFIKENTFNRLWSIRMTRARVIVAALTFMAGGAALLWVIFSYTPLRALIPGHLDGDLRSKYIATALRLDSLEQETRRTDAYIANIRAIMEPDVNAESSVVPAIQAVSADSLGASQLERDFLESYEENSRFNISVLAPIAAEGMVFARPLPDNAVVDNSSDGKGVSYRPSRPTPLTAVYRGTVVASGIGADGLTSIVVQHPNDFLSVYSGLAEAFVSKGAKVTAGQRLGHSSANTCAVFELWHKGSALDPRDYFTFGE